MYRSARNVIQSTLIHSSRKSKPRRICSKSTNTSSRSEKDPISSTVPPPSSSSQSAQGPISWKALAVFGTVGTAGLLYYSREKQRRMEGVFG